ncbi:MAG TPA: delta-60 repeat domain-containing protein, partial [Tepidisphaeraceae bacterium]|nr:delta-60 repeat domain-containing protein [Tepidisphaeraceae bacterium]
MQVSRSGRLTPSVQQHRAALIERLEPRQLLSAGDLDTTFQTTGLYINPTLNGGVHDIAITPDGSFYAAVGTGTMAVQKYSSTGQLQSTFTASKVTIGGYVNWGAATVALQDDGKILLAGASFADSTHDGSASIARLTTAGQADTSWNGTGVVQLTLPGVKELGISSLAIQDDGKIVAAGGAETSFFVARFTSDGALDP